MSTSQPDASRQSEDRATPDSLLHTRTGAEVSPEDLVLASGKDLTPQNIEVGQEEAGRGRSLRDGEDPSVDRRTARSPLPRQRDAVGPGARAVRRARRRSYG